MPVAGEGDEQTGVQGQIGVHGQSVAERTGRHGGEDGDREAVERGWIGRVDVDGATGVRRGGGTNGEGAIGREGDVAGGGMVKASKIEGGGRDGREGDDIATKGQKDGGAVRVVG